VYGDDDLRLRHDEHVHRQPDVQHADLQSDGSNVPGPVDVLLGRFMRAVAHVR
jgi:hypothetical protein